MNVWGNPRIIEDFFSVILTMTKTISTKTITNLMIANMKTRNKGMKKIKRSDAYRILREYATADITNRMLDDLQSARLKFEPEELSAVEKWNAAVNLRSGDGIILKLKMLEHAGDAMRDELQAEIERLKMQKSLCPNCLRKGAECG
jgi:hypothetical protein